MHEDDLPLPIANCTRIHGILKRLPSRLQRKNGSRLDGLLVTRRGKTRDGWKLAVTPRR